MTITSADISYVYREWNKLAMRVTHRVTLSTKSCTCIFMNQYKLPCRHLIAMLHIRRQLDKVFGYFDKIYSIANYAAAFADEAVHLPLDQDLTNDNMTLPPVLERKRGRPKSKHALGVTVKMKTAGLYIGAATVVKVVTTS
ncbi:hypothetical protein P3T76_011520 [Phytophthora citrophthora]|uniref:SWIM-type domain-containing protein n=1 Tax=Phytophthora citrophthora TaxID=4793 RepID=A0AAD9G9I8_9STRA|nr:hypothetical protein P3T76_011520 [Phytophthora citrophthora]